MTCRHCEQARKAVGQVWRRITSGHRTCIVRGCHGTAAPTICVAHWKALPLALRQRWWHETGYGAQSPSPELVAEINRAVAR